jgi:LysR family cys regulon transcriptional activator
MGKQMNFQQLRTIRELPSHSFNLTSMAAAMAMTQPGVSRHIRDIEEEMGLPIFERTGNRITGLSSQGKVILTIVERLLNEADKLLDASRAYSTVDSGLLSIAITHTQARYALPQVVQSFRAAFPGVRIALQQSTPEQIARSVVSGAADVGISTEGLAQVPELVAFPCYHWRHQVLVPDGHPLLACGALTLADLAEFPLLTYDHGFTGRHQIDKAFAAAGLRPNVVLTAMDSDVIKQYVQLGLGVGLLASMAFDAEQDAGLKALDAHHLFAVNTTWLAVRRGAYLRAYTYEFMRHFAPQLTRAAIDRALRGDADEALDPPAARSPFPSHTLTFSGA